MPISGTHSSSSGGFSVARRETRVKNRLLADTTIQNLADQRVFDTDYRVSGWNSAPVDVLDQDGLMQPSIVVTDGTVARPIGVFDTARTAQIMVWTFANRSPHGADAVASMMDRVETLLHHWQDPTNRDFYVFTSRQGRQFVEDGVMDTMLFSVAHVR